MDNILHSHDFKLATEQPYRDISGTKYNAKVYLCSCGAEMVRYAPLVDRAKLINELAELLNG